MSEIIISVSSVLAMLIPIIWKLRLELKQEKSKLNDLCKKHLSSSMFIDLRKLNEIKDVVNDLFKNSAIDRFMLLSSVNGKDPVNHVSVLIEQHKHNEDMQLSIGATAKYVDIRTDDEYKKMIRTSESVSPVLHVTENMNSGMLKTIYESENVTSSYVIFTLREKLDNENDKLIFCSWATHSNEQITDFDKIRIESANNKIKTLIQ